ncbi:MAG: tRNA uridine-5-carboxymethylaminomethyl(34) synthesis GTPase MnmE [Nitrospira bacterium HGW-Nitrospira-1]|nr:MAG: tRNA uridine-5-carboxymethylaminomethyl(34) synthesis GTPase MnmE [Nitrospira bacterium HGW-Nitrospira-1]
MRFENDTIAAISTPVGQGGIGIVRISGPQALEIADRLFRAKKADIPSVARQASLLYGHIINPADNTIMDEALLSVMRSPHSYTKEDVVEINCHGGIISVKRTLEAVLAQGARLADPGEFTKRAFLNGRINLTQAEAVFDIITAKTEEGMRIAVEQLQGGLSEKLGHIKNKLLEIGACAEAYIDFPEDEIGIQTLQQIRGRLAEAKDEINGLSSTFQEARFFRDGLSVAIVGRPNVGKSSLLNILLKKDRAIVTELPGTTRDIIEDYLNINGLPIRIMDTAGIRNSEELVEKEGIRRSLHAIQNADFIIALLDGSEPLAEDDFQLMELISGKNAVVVINKSDLPAKLSLETVREKTKEYLSLSALSGEGVETLKSAIFHANLRNWGEEREGVVVTNIRHKTALDNTSSSIGRAIGLLSANQPLELFSIELREAMDSLGEITGMVTPEDILDKIFSAFCIGK